MWYGGTDGGSADRPWVWHGGWVVGEEEGRQRLGVADRPWVWHTDGLGM